MRHKGTVFFGLLLAVGLLALTTALLAQREPPRPPQEGRRDSEAPPQGGFGQPGMWFGSLAQPGRFVVARVDRTQIVLLDTATGRLYAVEERDILPYRELPAVGGPPVGFGGAGGFGGPPPRGGRDPVPPRRGRRDDGDRPAEPKKEEKKFEKKDRDD